MISKKKKFNKNEKKRVYRPIFNDNCEPNTESCEVRGEIEIENRFRSFLNIDQTFRNISLN